MKRMKMMASAPMMALAANAGNGELQPFSGIVVNVPARVRVVQGDEYGMRIQAADSLVQSAVRYRVEDGVLSIGVRDARELSPESRLYITVFSPVVQEVKVGRNMLIQNVAAAPSKPTSATADTRETK